MRPNSIKHLFYYIYLVKECLKVEVQILSHLFAYFPWVFVIELRDSVQVMLQQQQSKIKVVDSVEDRGIDWYSREVRQLFEVDKKVGTATIQSV